MTKMYRILIALCISVQLYSQELSEVNRLMLESYKKGDYLLALKHGRQAADITQNKYGKKSDIYITSLSTLAFIYEAMDSLVQAEEIFKQGLTITKENGLSASSRISMLTGLASLHKSRGKYNDAVPLFSEALILAETNKLFDTPQYFITIKDLAQCAESNGDYSESEKYYHKAMDYLSDRNLKSSNEYAEIIGAMAALYRREGKYSKSEESYLKAIDILKESNKFSPADYAYYVNGLGGLYHNLNDFEKAGKYYNEAKDIRLKLFGDSSAEYAQSLNNLALLNEDLGKLNEAELMYKTVLHIWMKEYGVMSPIYAITLNNLAVLYGRMGRLEEAVKLFTETLNIRKRAFGEGSLNYANSLNNIAAVLKNMGYFDEAEKFLIKSIKLFGEKLDKNHPDYITAISNLASVYDAESKFKEAEKLYLEALSVRKKILGVKSADYANSLHNMGVMYFRMGQYEKADKYLSEAVAIRKQVLGFKHLDYILSVSNLARLKETMNDFNASKELWLQSLDLYIERIHSIFPFLSEEEKGKFYVSINEKFEMFNSFVFRHYDKHPELLSNLINYQIEIKGLLLNSIGKMRANIMKSGDEKLKSAYSDWISMKEELALLYSSAKDNDKKAVIIDSLEKSANEYEKKLSLVSESYPENYYNKIYTFDSVRNLLKNDECALEVIRFKYNEIAWKDTIGYAFVVISSAKAPDVVYMMNGNELEGKYYSDYINLIKNKINDKVSFGRFFEKVIPSLRGVKTIYFSPDGVYNKINLFTLRKTDGSYPMRDWDISIITAMRDLFRKDYLIKGAKSAALFGNPAFTSNGSADKRDISVSPLPGTETEVKNIKALLDKKNIECHTFLGKDANIRNLKNLNNPSILHIATHGFFFEDYESSGNETLFGISREKMKVNPLLRSGLILSGSGKTISDTSKYGVLTAYEAMSMELDSTLFVVLSACETGLGEVKNGEGVYGLQRAFTAAGAKYIIMSLWKVSDDVTSELMASFYENYSLDGDVKQSFKKAQLKISEKYKEPFYWGAFVVLGK